MTISTHLYNKLSIPTNFSLLFQLIQILLMNFLHFNFHVKIFCVKIFLLSSSSSFAVLKRCGAFLIVLMTLFTALSFADRWLLLLPPPSVSTIVGSAELLLLLLLLRFNDPSRKERDNERESGLNFLNVDVPEELGDDSSARFSNSDVTNLSRSAISVAFCGSCALLLPAIIVDAPIVLPSTSESYFVSNIKRVFH
jgi:hypothetical protein